MTSDEHQRASIPGEAPRGPQYQKRRLQAMLQAVLTACAFILVVGLGLTPGGLSVLLEAAVIVFTYATSLLGIEVYMVVGFVLAMRAMKQNSAFRRGAPGYGRSFVWGRRLALAGLAPLAVGYLGFFWYYPILLDEWRTLNYGLVGFFALLGAALAVSCSGIVLICVAFIWAVWQRVRSVVRCPSGASNA